jgi:hypothetical protein
MSASNTTPFFPSSSRTPAQLPLSRGRDDKSPPQVGGTSTGPNSALADEPGPISRIEPSRTGAAFLT